MPEKPLGSSTRPVEECFQLYCETCLPGLQRSPNPEVMEFVRQTFVAGAAALYYLLQDTSESDLDTLCRNVRDELMSYKDSRDGRAKLRELLLRNGIPVVPGGDSDVN